MPVAFYANDTQKVFSKHVLQLFAWPAGDMLGEIVNGR